MPGCILTQRIPGIYGVKTFRPRQPEDTRWPGARAGFYPIAHLGPARAYYAVGDRGAWACLFPMTTST
jgi:hypothetical protein